MSAVPSKASLVTLSPSDTSVPVSAGGWGWHSSAEVGSGEQGWFVGTVGVQTAPAGDG